MKKIFLILVCITSLLTINSTHVQAADNLDFDKISIDSAKKTTSLKIDKKNLLDGYWENNIQCRKVYKFFKNGIVIEYDIEPDAVINKKNLFNPCSLQYHFSGKKLVIESEDGYQTILKPVTTDSSIKWDGGLVNQIKKIPDDMVFFYETGWRMSETNFDDNAMYLTRSTKLVKNTNKR